MSASGTWEGLLSAPTGGRDCANTLQSVGRLYEAVGRQAEEDVTEAKLMLGRGSSYTEVDRIIRRQEIVDARQHTE